MLIKIIKEVPVEPEHNILIGNVYKVIKIEYEFSKNNRERTKGYWVKGAIENVLILKQEMEVV